MVNQQNNREMSNFIQISEIRDKYFYQGKSEALLIEIIINLTLLILFSDSNIDLFQLVILSRFK